MSTSDARLEGLSVAKRRLVEQLLRQRGAPANAQASPAPMGGDGLAPMDFSLFFFSDDGSAPAGEKYKLLLESARFADSRGFKAVWTPERHFHPFGGPYPNPALVAAALATITRRIELRAGSVVLPLHHPLRVAEDWAVVDNLSGGRAAVSFASGWHLDDFALAPDAYGDRKAILMQHLETVRRLWRGDALSVVGVGGKPVSLTTFPRPIRPELPVWITSAGNPETFVTAGHAGAHLLTGLTGQRVDDLAEKIASYRSARAHEGFDPRAGRVALMLHTYLGDDMERVRQRVRAPMTEYLRTSLGLHERQARTRATGLDSVAFDAADEQALLAHAFERYFQGGGLFGTPRACLGLVARLHAAGVDEVACLIDFGLSFEDVMSGLEPLAELVAMCASAATVGPRT